MLAPITIHTRPYHLQRLDHSAHSLIPCSASTNVACLCTHDPTRVLLLVTNLHHSIRSHLSVDYTTLEARITLKLKNKQYLYMRLITMRTYC